ncbi:hypothetical protein EYF80_011260 [Liparis tanakae]|uniref:Uncharacterized protein n=1 Tax=Liparis tanakae TaxID=230148 RepID=A0A4Z2IL51_9TELE|nr:hypothetical protein EYF80_011260 [Liparis tanakae]
MPFSCTALAAAAGLQLFFAAASSRRGNAPRVDVIPVDPQDMLLGTPVFTLSHPLRTIDRIKYGLCDITPSLTRDGGAFVLPRQTPAVSSVRNASAGLKAPDAVAPETNERKASRNRVEVPIPIDSVVGASTCSLRALSHIMRLELQTGRTKTPRHPPRHKQQSPRPSGPLWKRCSRATFPTSIEVQIFVSSWRICPAVSQHPVNDLKASTDQSVPNQTLRNVQGLEGSDWAVVDSAGKLLRQVGHKKFTL